MASGPRTCPVMELGWPHLLHPLASFPFFVPHLHSQARRSVIIPKYKIGISSEATDLIGGDAFASTASPKHRTGTRTRGGGRVGSAVVLPR